MLTGSTLPLLPLLEGLVKKHAGSLTKRDQAVAAMRVQLGERWLGVNVNVNVTVNAVKLGDGGSAPLGLPQIASDCLG